MGLVREAKMIELSCSNCGKLLRIPEQFAGTVGRCNHCQTPVFVPSPALTPEQKRYIDSLPMPPRWYQTAPVAAWRLFDAALGAVCSFLNRMISGTPTRDWRSDPMTEKQRDFLIDLGADEGEIDGLTKGQASAMISVLKGEPVRGNDDAVAQAMRAHTNWQKNCCGLVLIVLLAPFWIPACGYIIGSNRDAFGPASYTPSREQDVPRSPTVRVVSETRRYHRPTCNRAKEAYITMTMAEAQTQGYLSCGLCMPEF